MMILRFRNNEDHEELLMKVKRMKKFTQELEDCLEEALEDTPEYRGGYRKACSLKPFLKYYYYVP